MRDDLLHAQASIDWAVTQLPSFEKKLRTWLAENIEVAVRNRDLDLTNDVVVAVEKVPFPLHFMVEAGAYINAIRSSLDILATSLAYRYRVPKPQDHYFPVAASKTIFESYRGYKGSELVQGLPQSERVKIETLQPYEGGNETLWALHRLDILRKHKRLIAPALLQNLMTVSAWGYVPQDVFAPAAWVCINGETIIGFLKKDRIDDPTIKIAPYVAINEAGRFRRKGVIETIREFGRFATGVVRLFDCP